MMGTNTKKNPITPNAHGVCIVCRMNSWTYVMIVHVLAALILDAVVALILDDFLLIHAG